MRDIKIIFYILLGGLSLMTYSGYSQTSTTYDLKQTFTVLDATLTGNEADIYVDQSYIELKGDASDRLDVTFNADTAGSYTVRYHMQTADVGSARKNKFFVNDVQDGTVSYSDTLWGTVDKTTTLSSGSNEISLRKNWGFTKIRYIEILSNSTVVKAYHLDDSDVSYSGSTIVYVHGSGSSPEGRVFINFRTGDETKFGYTFTAPEDGSYRFSFDVNLGYSSAAQNRAQWLYIDDVQIQSLIFNTDSLGETFSDSLWFTFEFDDIELTAGSHTIEVRKNWGFMYFADFRIYQEFQNVQISGSEGWRILSTPTSNNTYNDLLGGIWTQGIATGADATAGTANVQTFSNSTDSFSGISDMGTTMTAGNGFIVYVYSDDDYTNSGADAGFPKTLSVSGTENTGSVSPTLNGGTSGDDSFSLVGNPYASTIDWDLLTKTDLSGTVYVYDHSYGSVTAPDVSEAVGGGYRVWSGSTGSLTDGLITPFQGFWVQNSGGSAALTIEEADKSSGGTFYKEAKSMNFALKSEIGNMFDETFFSFGENASLEKDNYDALQLSPLDYRPYMSLASRSNDDLFDVNNLPIGFDEIRVPVSVKAYTKTEGGYSEVAGSTKLSWSGLERLPENWELVLSDNETGNTVNLREVSEYNFELVGAKSKARTASVLTPLQPTKEKTVGNSDRFVLIISQTTSVNNEEETKVEGFALSQNYPNPFNPTTTINYSVENAGPVTISVYNLMGQKVAELVNESKAAGSYNVTWNAANAASGMYYYRLEAGGQTMTRKMTLIK
ncbi:MAG: T9SS type A sorting domain-containing protein [Balneola sp.]